jgi:hypothetical protein
MLYFTLANPKTISLSLFKFLFSFTTLKDAIMRATWLDSLTTFHLRLFVKMPAPSWLVPVHTLSLIWMPKSVSYLTLEKETAMHLLDLPSQLLKNAAFLQHPLLQQLQLLQQQPQQLQAPQPHQLQAPQSQQLQSQQPPQAHQPQQVKQKY